MDGYNHVLEGYWHAINAHVGYPGLSVAGLPLYGSLLALYSSNTGTNLVDDIDPLQVDPEATVGGANCLSFANSDAEQVEFSADIPVDDWNIEIWLKPRSYVAYQEVMNGDLDSTFLGFNNETGLVGTRTAGTSFYTTGANVLPLAEWSRVITKRVSGVITIEAYESDGTLRFSQEIGTDATTLTAKTFKLGGTTVARHLDGLLALVTIEGILDAPLQEGSGLPQDRSGNGSHATANTATYVQEDGIHSTNFEDGFYVAVQGTPPYIPAFPELMRSVATFDGLLDNVDFGTDNFNGVDCYAEAGVEWSSSQWMKVENGEQMFGLSRGQSTTIERPHMIRMASSIVSSWTPVIFINGISTQTNLGLDDGDWHHYAITWDGTTCKLYIDGSFSTNLNVGANPNVAEDWKMGIMSTSHGKGSLRDAGVWPVELSSAEVLALYNGIIPSDPAMFSKLDDGSGLTIANSAGVSGTITATDINEFWKAYIAEGGDRRIDVLGNNLTNLGGTVSNGAEVDFRMTDPSVINTIKVWVGPGSNRYEYDGLVDGKPSFTYLGVLWVRWSTSLGKWQANAGGAITHPTATGFFPPKIGWPDHIGLPYSIEYSSLSVENEEFKRWNHADLLNWKNLSGDTVIQFCKLGSNDFCHATGLGFYEQGTVDQFTLGNFNQAVRWIKDLLCGNPPELVTFNGELVTNDGLPVWDYN